MITVRVMPKCFSRCQVTQLGTVRARFGQKYLYINSVLAVIRLLQLCCPCIETFPLQLLVIHINENLKLWYKGRDLKIENAQQ